MSTGCRPPPLPLLVAKAGRNHLNEEITPLGLASDVAKPYQISDMCRCELPL
jgi:hypothetical protein